jgi:RNA polymerase sigma-70 factor (ECF subfamily)
LEDKDLIRSCMKGEVKGQRKLYEQFGPFLMSVCLRYAGNREDAEEIFHDSLMKVYGSISKFKGESSLKTWINRIGVNTSLDFLRKRKSALMVEHISDQALDIKDSDIETEISLEAETAMKLLGALSQNQQIIINMYVIDEMSHKEIAEKLNISEEASRSQYSRAKKALAELVKIKLLHNETRQ